MDKITGYWEGAIEVPNQPLPFIAEFERESGTLSIPVQGLSNFPFGEVSFEDPEVNFSMNLQGQMIVFDGALEDETISGTFTQQGQSFPFKMKRGTKEASAEIGEKMEVAVTNGKLTVQVEVPEGEGPHPVAVIIAGSGPTDKNGNSIALPGKNNSLKMLGEELKEQGIASVRFDKRGVGENMLLGGNEEELRFEDYIEDVVALVDTLKRDDRFSEISIIGHSEGALVGLAAVNRTQVDHFISLAGAGRTVDEVLVEQLTAQLPASLLEESKEIIDQLKQGELVSGVSPELQSVFRPSVQPYMISWLLYDPAEEIAKLNIPALIIGGTNDLQVPAEDAELLHASNESSELMIIEGMNHVLKEVGDSEEENIAAYADPELPLADGLMAAIVKFISSN
ncbi:alpha/beta fold hydrolase [Planomicrobium sp. YIM 101495]|nr:alpha/beta fold hydrolase [Planomicrobium sp. YIM 101495]